MTTHHRLVMRVPLYYDHQITDAHEVWSIEDHAHEDVAYEVRTLGGVQTFATVTEAFDRALFATGWNATVEPRYVDEETATVVTPMVEDELDIAEQAMTNAGLDQAQAHWFAHRIVKGAGYLDGVDARNDVAVQWWERIDLDRFDMVMCDRCILGQIVGSYEACDLTNVVSGRHQALRAQAEADGYTMDHGEAEARAFHTKADDIEGAYAWLTTGWRALIESRRG